MKKFLLFTVCTLLSLMLCSCTFQDPKYISLSKKPNNHYYTSELQEKLLDNNSFTLYVFDTNLYKEVKVSSDEDDIIENFIGSLTETNYLDNNIVEKEPFRIKIVFNDTSKYLIKVFNSSNISIAPWDGTFEEDSISMENVPLGYNLFEFCNHIQNAPASN